MNLPLLRHGRLRSPHLVYIRRPHEYSDNEILSLFQLAQYERVPEAPQFGRYTVIADADDWTLIADDWSYTLWNMSTTRPGIETLGQRHEVFACFVADCDDSFEFVHFRDGRLARKYHLAAPEHSPRFVVDDVGPPLPQEAELLPKCGYGNVETLAALLRLRTHFAVNELRIYAHP